MKKKSNTNTDIFFNTPLGEITHILAFFNLIATYKATFVKCGFEDETKF